MPTKNNMNDKILVALPAFNEGDYISSVIIRAKRYVSDIMVVDDGSSDDTVEIAWGAGAEVVEHQKNQGYGATIKTILEEAKTRQVDVLVILDADGQHNPSDIPNMIKAIQDGNDLAIGYRDRDSIPRYRKIGQGTISLFTRAISGSKVKDTQSGFRAFSKKAIEILDLKQMGMAISSEMTAEAARRKLKIIEVPISVKYTKDSSTINPVVQGVDTLTRVIIMISERKPLLFFGVSGILSVIGGIYLGIKTYNMMGESGILPIGTTLESVLLMMIGMLCIFTGIILNAMSRK